MTAFTSRRALLTFAKLVSPTPVIYRCPNCIRFGRGASVAGGRGKSLGIRQFSRGAVRYQSNEDPDPDEFEGSFLDYQLSTRKEDGRRIINEPPVEELAPKERRGKRIKSTSRDDELEQIAAGLEWSEMNIEELEDSLMDADQIESSAVEAETEDEELQPWYLRQEGGISEEEYSSIKALFNPEDSNEPTKIHQSEIMPHESAEERPSASQEDSDMLPWYLREQESDTSLTPRIDIEQTQLEKYPDIPSDGPPLLQPLVSRLFYDHHLRNIVLLDLRRRDPPPAWGSNTIMILATVRSERQLSSVAEATSKWLKTTAGVLPKTDGLPKRESLIIKRRRLRKKSLRKPGYLIAAPRPTTWVSMYTGYQGLVLQLFTEEGREEYDLEGLWGDSRIVDAAELDMKPRKVRPGGIEEDEPVEYNRSVSQKKPVWQKKEEKEEKKREKKMQLKSAKRRWTQEEKDQARKRRMKEAAGISFWESPRRGSSSGRRATYGDRQQRRQLHTSARRCAQYGKGAPPLFLGNKREGYPNWKTSHQNDEPKKHAAWWGDSAKSLNSLSDTILPSSVYEELLNQLKGQPPFSPPNANTQLLARTIALQGNRTRADKLANLSASNDPTSLRLLSHFGNLSQFVKASESAPDARLYRSTFAVDPFPETGFEWAFDFFLRDMPIRPTPHHWRLAILFYLNLEMVSPTQYRVRKLLGLLLLPVSQGISIPRSTFHLILNHIATSSPERRDIEAEATDYPTFLKNVHRRLVLMNNFLQVMKTDFGYDCRHDEEVYLALYKACSQPFPTLSDLIRDIDLPLPTHHSEVRKLRIAYYLDQNLPLSPEFFILELMGFAHRGKWESFLKRWRWTVDSGIGKDADMWAVFWGCLARGGHEYHIRTALKDHYHEMLDEGEHLVFNENIGIALGKCLEIVDPEEREFHGHRFAVRSMLGSSSKESEESQGPEEFRQSQPPREFQVAPESSEQESQESQL